MGWQVPHISSVPSARVHGERICPPLQGMHHAPASLQLTISQMSHWNRQSEENEKRKRTDWLKMKNEPQSGTRIVNLISLSSVFCLNSVSVFASTGHCTETQWNTGNILFYCSSYSITGHQTEWFWSLSEALNNPMKGFCKQYWWY